MSIYSNVTEKDLDNQRKLSEQQKNERALKIKNRILKQTHEVKLAENLSPVTKKLEETSKNLGEVIKESTQNLENVINENITPKPAIENTQTQSSILYDASLENTLTNMKEKEKGFFKIREDIDGQRYWNNLPIEILGDSRIKIEVKILI